MANEGSTKPTYEELEDELRLTRESIGKLRELLGVDTESAAVIPYHHVKSALSELARVRGLLQRLEWSSADGDGYAMCPVCEAEGPVANCPADPHEADCWLAAAINGTPANEALPSERQWVGVERLPEFAASYLVWLDSSRQIAWLGCDGRWRLGDEVCTPTHWRPLPDPPPPRPSRNLLHLCRKALSRRTLGN